MPGILRWRVQRKSKKIIKRYLFALLFFPAAFIVWLGIRISGIFPKAIMLLGLIVIVKLFFYLRSKASDNIIGFLKKQPIMFFRLWALLQTATGFVIVYLF
jgi:hypothetical protein